MKDYLIYISATLQMHGLSSDYADTIVFDKLWLDHDGIFNPYWVEIALEKELLHCFEFNKLKEITASVRKTIVEFKESIGYKTNPAEDIKDIFYAGLDRTDTASYTSFLEEDKEDGYSCLELLSGLGGDNFLFDYSDIIGEPVEGFKDMLMAKLFSDKISVYLDEVLASFETKSNLIAA